MWGPRAHAAIVTPRRAGSCGNTASAARSNNLNFFVDLEYKGGGHTVMWLGDVGVCRLNDPGSYHHTSRALDLTKVRISGNDAYWIDMNWSWRPARSLGHKRAYLAVAASLRRYFGNVLTGWYDGAHADHIHFDDAYATTPPIRDNVKSDTTLVQAACKFLNSANIDINGVWGNTTETAFDNLRVAFGMQGARIREDRGDTQVFLANIVKHGLGNRHA